jgi:hypothetical protein
MTSTNPLPENIKVRIANEAHIYSGDSFGDYLIGVKESAYIEGATAEASRSLVLTKALEHITKGTHNGETVYQFALRVQNIAIDVLQ